MATEMYPTADAEQPQPQEPSTESPDRIELPDEWSFELEDWSLEEAGYGHGV